MTSVISRSALLAMAALFQLSAPASACSVERGYRTPTNLELVEQADAIVIGRIESGGRLDIDGVTIPADMDLAKARLEVLEVIKGVDIPRTVDFDGAAVATGRWRATESDPRNLVDANPDALSGSCNRSTFNKGMILVAFLRRSGERWYPNMAPFARTLEDVPAVDALWVKAVRTYAQIAAKPKSQRIAEMKRQRDLLGFDLGNPDARLLALELDRALDTAR